MRGVVVQRAHDHAACPRKHPSRITPPWIGQISHRAAITALQPFVKRGMFRKPLQWRHAAQRKTKRGSALPNPRRISCRIHDLIVPQERQSSEAGFNGEKEKRLPGPPPWEGNISLTILIQLLLIYSRPL